MTVRNHEKHTPPATATTMASSMPTIGVATRIKFELFQSKNISGISVGENVDIDCCVICDCVESTEDNKIVLCDGCNIAVHQACYGIIEIPTGDWLCRRCILGVGTGNKRSKCVFCPDSKGAMKLTTDNKWAHIRCAWWDPNLYIDPSDGLMEPIKYSYRPTRKRLALKCCVCPDDERSSMGRCVQCSFPGCNKAFHSTCARPNSKAFLEMRVELGVICSDSLCPEHISNKATIDSVLQKVVEDVENGSIKSIEKDSICAIFKNIKRKEKVHPNVSVVSFENTIYSELNSKLSSVQCEFATKLFLKHFNEWCSIQKVRRRKNHKRRNNTLDSNKRNKRHGKRKIIPSYKARHMYNRNESVEQNNKTRHVKTTNKMVKKFYLTNNTKNNVLNGGIHSKTIERNPMIHRTITDNDVPTGFHYEFDQFKSNDSVYCTICNILIQSIQEYKYHLTSGKHKQNQARQIKMIDTINLSSINFRSEKNRQKKKQKLLSVENQVCSVCESKQTTHDNKIILCNGCNIAVHQACYGIIHIPTGDWLCRRCEMGVGTGNKRSKCVFCPHSKGAMKLTTDNKWAHIRCAWWDPDTVIENIDTSMEPIRLQKCHSSRQKLKCVICTRRDKNVKNMKKYNEYHNEKPSAGRCLKCTFPGCSNAFHIGCVVGNIENTITPNDEKSSSFLSKHCATGYLRSSVEDFGIKIREAYCPQHAHIRNSRSEIIKCIAAAVGQLPEKISILARESLEEIKLKKYRLPSLFYEELIVALKSIGISQSRYPQILHLAKKKMKQLCHVLRIDFTDILNSQTQSQIAKKKIIDSSSTQCSMQYKHKGKWINMTIDSSDKQDLYQKQYLTNRRNKTQTPKCSICYKGFKNDQTSHKDERSKRLQCTGIGSEIHYYHQSCLPSLQVLPTQRIRAQYCLFCGKKLNLICGILVKT